MAGVRSLATPADETVGEREHAPVMSHTVEEWVVVLAWAGLGAWREGASEQGAGS